jgi:hypothetical protein
MVQNSVLFATVTPQGKLVSSSMKISSFLTQVLSAYQMYRDRRLPEGFREDDGEFSLEPGKNKWDVAILRAFTSQQDQLWFLPSEGLAMTSRAVQKFYGMQNEKGHVLAQEYFEQRAEHLKKMDAAPYKVGMFPMTAEALMTPEYAVNLNGLLNEPNFPALITTLARACHAMTGAVACSNLTEGAIARQPVSLAKFNQFLSSYVVDEVTPKTATRTGGTFTTVLQLLRTLHTQQAENNRRPGQNSEHKFTTFEILDSNAGEKYTVKTQLKTMHAEDLSPPKGKAPTDREKRITIGNILHVIDQNARNSATSSSIKLALLKRLQEDAQKSATSDMMPVRITEADVEDLVNNVHFTHVATSLPGLKRYAYPAARMVTSAHGPATFSPNPTAAIMLYFFLKRYGLDNAADELFNNVIAGITAQFPLEASIFDHLKLHFSAKNDSTRTRSHAFSGFEAATAMETREFDNSAAAARQQALQAAAISTRRSPSPVRATAGGWNGQAGGQPEWSQAQPARTWTVPVNDGAAGGSAAQPAAPLWVERVGTGAAQSWQPGRSPSAGGNAASPHAQVWDQPAGREQSPGRQSPPPFRASSAEQSRAGSSAPWVPPTGSWNPNETGAAWSAQK